MPSIHESGEDMREREFLRLMNMCAEAEVSAEAGLDPDLTFAEVIPARYMERYERMKREAGGA